MANAFDRKQNHTIDVTPKAKAPKPNLPQASKVLAQHTIAKTQNNIAEIQKVGAMRTQVVLQTFDDVMAKSDRDIIEGLEQRLGGSTDSFFGDVESQFAALTDGSIVTLPTILDTSV